MKPGDVKRLEQLEARMGAGGRGGGGLDAEIAVMQPDERTNLRIFLEHWCAGGKEGEPEFERLKAIATVAVMAARARL